MEWVRELEQQVGQPEEFAAGEWIYQEGDPGTLLFLLLEGAVELVRRGKPYCRIGPATLFGEEAALGEADRSDAALAVTPVRLLPLGPARLAQLSIRRTNVLADLQSLSRHRRALRAQVDSTVGDAPASIPQSHEENTP